MSIEICDLYNRYDSIYGPYKRKDGRYVIVLTKHGEKNKIIERRTVSYPKYLVESYLGRLLLPNETIDHIDEDFTNNDLSNLRVVDRREHCRSHVKLNMETTKTCIICGKSFVTKDGFRVTCGSKHCVGKTAHLNGYNKGYTYNTDETGIEKESQRKILADYKSVIDTNN